MEKEPPVIDRKYSPGSLGIGGTKKHLDFLQFIMYTIIVVLSVGFIAAFIAVGGEIVNREAEKKTSYENLKNEVLKQNSKIDALSEKISSDKQSATEIEVRILQEEVHKLKQK